MPRMRMHHGNQSEIRRDGVSDREMGKVRKRSVIWNIWAKALGEKASHKKKEADTVAIVRTLIFLSYLTTNTFIIAGVVRHWNDDSLQNLTPTQDRCVQQHNNDVRHR